MARLSLLSTAMVALAGSLPLASPMTVPAFAQDWANHDEDVASGGLRDLLADRFRARQERRDMLMDLLQERSDRRSDLLDRVRERLDRRGDLADLLGDRPGLRDRLRERLRERIAERHDMGGDGGCYFLTRSLRDEDGNILIVIRRRICRD